MGLDFSNLNNASFDREIVGAYCLLCVVGKNRKEGNNGAADCMALV